ncbi:(2Fe-2S)-binding protein [Prauserella marina]|uniref:Carbon-monoxide dehydrogenase small subunit n=1 Tax=Prauserella marina TaxID=530584 RepID=A0A222VQ19_9PSEU|nr:(2Fe-2S)-binding protein [Prauserella marina]ASR36015.1 (2Fe-2S)-binding protein [Prauserella marina]PWV84038.1 carbon-monoxide dehydrogenase small subunit [Prauserella marina]SDC31918.1 carbon-monoxide dehydrogenase small subunit [Prauserella marina]
MPPPPPARVVTLVVNGRQREFLTPPCGSLLTALREKLGLTSAKRGCGQGSCGSCTVLVDGKAVLSCLLAVETIDASTVETLEGVAKGNDLDEIQQAFLDGFATQCGFCTPGMIMAAEALLSAEPEPGRADVMEAMCGNVCRCTGYQPIVEAIMTAARLRAAGGTP